MSVNSPRSGSGLNRNECAEPAEVTGEHGMYEGRSEAQEAMSSIPNTKSYRGPVRDTA